MRARKGLGTPEPRPAGPVADRAEDIEGDPAGRDPSAAGVQGLTQKARWSRRSEPRPAKPSGGEARRRPVRTARPSRRRAARDRTHAPRRSLHRSESPGRDHARRGRPACRSRRHRQPPCLGDSSGDGLVMARRFRALAALDLTLAVIAGTAPALLAGQELGEHVWPAAPTRRALVALAPIARLRIRAVQLDSRTRVFRPNALRVRCADPRHRPRLPGQPDGLAQPDARGGRTNPEFSQHLRSW